MNFNNLPRFVFDGRNITYENGSDTAINLMDSSVVNKLLRQGCIVGDTVESWGLDGVNRGLNIDENGIWHPCNLNLDNTTKDRGNGSLYSFSNDGIQDLFHDDVISRAGRIVKDGLVNDTFDRTPDLWEELTYSEDEIWKSIRELESYIVDLRKEIGYLKSELRSLREVLCTKDIRSDDVTLEGFFEDSVLDNKKDK